MATTKKERVRVNMFQGMQATKATRQVALADVPKWHVSYNMRNRQGRVGLVKRKTVSAVMFQLDNLVSLSVASAWDLRRLGDYYVVEDSATNRLHFYDMSLMYVGSYQRSATSSLMVVLGWSVVSLRTGTQRVQKFQASRNMALSEVVYSAGQLNGTPMTSIGVDDRYVVFVGGSVVNNSPYDVVVYDSRTNTIAATLGSQNPDQPRGLTVVPGEVWVGLGDYTNTPLRRYSTSTWTDVGSVTTSPNDFLCGSGYYVSDRAAAYIASGNLDAFQGLVKVTVPGLVASKLTGSGLSGSGTTLKITRPSYGEYVQNIYYPLQNGSYNFSSVRKLDTANDTFSSSVAFGVTCKSTSLFADAEAGRLVAMKSDFSGLTSIALF